MTCCRTMTPILLRAVQGVSRSALQKRTGSSCKKIRSDICNLLTTSWSSPVLANSIPRCSHATSCPSGWSPFQRTSGTAPTREQSMGIATNPVGDNDTEQADDVSATAQSYYDDLNALNYHRQVWGEDLHIGRYDLVKGEDSKLEGKSRIKRAGALSTSILLSKANLYRKFSFNGSTIMDMGSAYGTTARTAVKDYGCNVVCIEISRGFNARNAELSSTAGLSDKIIIPGERSFFDTQVPASSIDVVVSQDALCHGSTEVYKAIKEAARVLKPGGIMAFTDVMKSDTQDPASAAEVFSHTTALEYPSPGLYEKLANEHGLEFLDFDNQTHNFGIHYSNIIDVISSVKGTIEGVEDQFLDGMAERCGTFVRAHEKDIMRWGIIVLQKKS